jgi:hypothetical protein
MDVPSRVEITLTVPVFSSSKETSSKAAAPASAKRETGERYTAFAPPPKEAREFGSNAHRPGADEADPSDSIRSSSTFSRIRLLILRANGKLLDTDAAQNRNSSVSLLCEIPAENYPALRRDLFLLGATGGADIELDPPPRTILLRIEMVPRK